MKKILDEKLVLLCGQVDNAQKAKEQSLDSALSASTKTLQNIQKSIEQIQNTQKIDCPEALLHNVDDTSPGLMLVQLAPPSVVSNQMFCLSPAMLNHQKSILSTMKYRDQKIMDDTQFASMMLGFPGGEGGGFGLMDPLTLEEFAVQGQQELNSDDVDDFYDGEDMFDDIDGYGPGGPLVFQFPIG